MKRGRSSLRGGLQLARRALCFGAVTAFTAALVSINAVPAQALPAMHAQQVRNALMAQILQAAAPSSQLAEEPAQPGEGEAPVQPGGGEAAAAPAEEPLSTDTWTGGGAFQIAASEAGVSAEFSGYQVNEDLSLAISQLPAQRARAAALQAGGTVVGQGFEVNATSADGSSRTEFPAQITNQTEASNGKPAHADVTPGVLLKVAVTPEAIDAAGVDARTLKLYTREAATDPWEALPSYYDEASGQVIAESTHLSQFVVIGTPFPVPPGPRVVLDPDQNVGHTDTPAAVTEGPYNVQLSLQVAAALNQACIANVALTGTDPNSMVSDETRAGIAAASDPNATVTLAFNALVGHAWGDAEGDDGGGTQVYSRALNGLDAGLSNEFLSIMPQYTGRPAEDYTDPGEWPPGPAFNGVPGAMTHVEVLFLDNNADWARINDPAGWQSIVNGVTTSVGKYLETQGFDCSDPARGGLPTPPSAAELARWRQLGMQNYQTYGSEPISFSTGNLIEQFPTFSLSGPGGQALDGTLTYNSQDGRLTRVGAGWSFAYGTHVQRFIDGSALLVRGDGASFSYTPDGAGGYVPDQGVKISLVDQGGGVLKATDPDGSSWVFDASNIFGIGNLTSTTDRQGRTTTFSYGAAGDDSQFLPLTGITDSAGQTIAVANDTFGRITSFTLPDGRAWQLSYDAAGNLAGLTDPAGGARSFTYDGSHQLLTATDPTGVTYLTNTYDASGRVTKQLDGDGRVRTIDYSGGKTVYTNQNGDAATYEYDERSRIVSAQQPGEQPASYTYYDDDTVQTFTDAAGRTWSYEYDDGGNITRQTLPDGTALSYVYSELGDLLSITDQGGRGGKPRTTTFEVDAAGNTTAIHRPDGTTVTQHFDAAGNLTSSSLPSGATTTYTYDGHGNLASQTDADGVVTSYGYDATGRLSSITDGRGNASALAWTGIDRIASSTDAEGGVTTYSYDGNGNLRSSTDPAGGVTTYQWDKAWNMTQVTDPLGGVTRTEFDGENHATRTTDQMGAAVNFILDKLGRPTETVDPLGGKWGSSYDAAGDLVTATDPSGAVTRYSYDALDRLTSTEDPTGGKTAYTYDEVGRVVSAEDANGGTVHYEYDLLDRVTKVTDQAGSVTRSLYDTDGNQVGVVDRQGNPTAYEYSKAGRLLSQTDAMGGKTSYAYDAAGNLLNVKDALDRVTTLAYDKKNRAIAVTDPQGAVTSYGYDAVGRVTRMTDADGHATQTVYDAGGQVVQTIDATGAVTSYAYDAAGRQVRATDAVGNVTKYVYDEAGQLTSVIEHPTGGESNATANVTNRYAYDRVGNLTSITDPNGNLDEFSYDAAGRVSGEKNAAGQRWSYRYDKLGQLLQEATPTGKIDYGYTATGDLATQTAGGQTTSYTYDKNQRLIAAENSQGLTGYVYDKAGRMVQQLDTQGKQLGYSYDSAGQLTGLTLPATSGSGTQKVGFRYDSGGRLTAQTSPWGDLAYSYDPAGLLTQTERSLPSAKPGEGEPGPVTNYSYDPAGRVTSILTQTVASTKPESVAPKSTVSSYVRQPDLGPCATLVEPVRANPKYPAGCLSTGDYLSNRQVPAKPGPVLGGDAVQTSYHYDKAGNVTGTARAIGQTTNTGVLAGATLSGDQAPVPAVSTAAGASAESLLAVDANASSSPEAGRVSTAYTYDALNRLTSSTASDGARNSYGYDAAGNRTSWTRTDDAGTSKTTAAYNKLNQVTKTETTGVGAGSASYQYDAAGNRTSQNVAGRQTAFGYDGLGQLTRVSDPDRSTVYGYDGAGNRVSSVDTTQLGTVSTGTLFAGRKPVQTDNSVAGVTSLVYDASEALAAEGRTDTQRWDLLDRLGSTVAQATGGQVTQLSGYSDYGVPSFVTDGWDAPAGFSGQVQDPGYGLAMFTARAYDPRSGVWVAQDRFRGLLSVPASLRRYGYVGGNPLTLVDVGGYSWLGDLWNGVKRAVNTVVNTVRNVVNTVVNTVKSAVNTAVSGVRTVVGAVGNAITGGSSGVAVGGRGGGGGGGVGGMRGMSNTPQVIPGPVWNLMHPLAKPQNANTLKVGAAAKPSDLDCKFTPTRLGCPDSSFNPVPFVPDPAPKPAPSGPNEYDGKLFDVDPNGAAGGAVSVCLVICGTYGIDSSGQNTLSGGLGIKAGLSGSVEGSTETKPGAFAELNCTVTSGQLGVRVAAGVQWESPHPYSGASLAVGAEEGCGVEFGGRW